MSLGSWYISRGRITRRTFWLKYLLPLMAVALVLQVVVLSVVQATGASTDEGGGLPGIFWLVFVFWLAALPPSVSSQVTRLHDRGHSAWWLLFGLIPLVGGILLLVQAGFLPGDPRPNRYGPPPAGELVPEPGYPQSYS